MRDSCYKSRAARESQWPTAARIKIHLLSSKWAKGDTLPHQVRHNCCTLSRNRNQRTNTPVINMILTDQHIPPPAIVFWHCRITLTKFFFAFSLWEWLYSQLFPIIAFHDIIIYHAFIKHIFWCNYESLACEKYSESTSRMLYIGRKEVS